MNGEICGTVLGTSHPPSIEKLKSIIKSIDEQKEQNCLCSKIEQFEMCIERMGSMKVSFNYEKYISHLFDKINLILNTDKKNASYVKIFLQLNRVFPDIKDYLAQYNKDNLIIEKIHSLSNNNTKMKFYIAYTDNFIKFDNVYSKNILLMYHFLFTNYIIKEKTINFSFIKSFVQIIILLCHRIKMITNKEIPLGKLDESQYLIIIVESFIDVFIYILIKSLYSSSAEALDETNIFVIMTLLFSSYLDLKKIIRYLNPIVIGKITCMFCLFYSYALHSKSNIAKSIKEQFMNLYKDNQSKVDEYLFAIFFSMNSNGGKLLNFFSVKVYIPYFTIFLRNDLSMTEHTILDDYEENMKKITTTKAEFNLYKGCIDFITKIFKDSKETINKRKFPFLVTIVAILKKENENEVYHCKKEISLVLMKYMKNNHNKYEYDELTLIIKSLYLLCENLSQKNYQSSFYDNILTILKILFESIRYIELRPELIKEMSDAFFSYINKNLNFDDDMLEIVKYFSLNMRNVNYQQLIEPYVLLAIKYNKNDYTQLISLFDRMSKILQSDDKEKKNNIEAIVLEKYDMLYSKIIRDNDNDAVVASFAKLIANIVINSNDTFKENLTLINIKFSINDKYYIVLYKELLIASNVTSYHKVIAYLFELTLSKEIFSADAFFTSKKDLELLNLLLEWLNVTQQGVLVFCNNNTYDACLRKSTMNSVMNSEMFYYIDIDLVIGKYINHLAVLCEYVNSKKSSTVEVSDVEILFEKISEKLFMFSEANLFQVIKIYLFTVSNGTANWKSVCNFLITICYMLNYQKEEYYINGVEKQSNEIYNFNKELRLKDSIVDTFIEYNSKANVNKKRKKYAHRIVLLCFYLNSSLDVALDKKSNHPLIGIIDKLISYLFFGFIPLEEFRKKHNFLILTTLYTVKDIMKFADDSLLIQYIYIILLLSRPQDISVINSAFQEYTKILNSSAVLDYKIDEEVQPFYFYLCDVLCLYYLSFLDEEISYYEKGKMKKGTKKRVGYSIKRIINSRKKNNRDIIFEKMCDIVLFSRTEMRCNVEQEELIQNINQYQYMYSNKRILCVKENEMIMITPVSTLRFNLSFKQNEIMVNSKEDKINLLKHQNVNKNINNSSIIPFEDFYPIIGDDNDQSVITTMHEIISSILSHPVKFTYHINVFYYPSKYSELTIDALLEEFSSEKSSLYYQFISQLGDVYLDEDGEKVLAYKDSFYEIIFDLADAKTESEKRKMITENTVNIIWLDNPYIDTSNILKLFDPIANHSNLSIVTIAPKSNSHFLVKKKFKNMNTKILEYFFADNYFININAYSGIRYLRNNIILLCDWHCYVDPHCNEAREVYSNCLIQRLELFQSFMLN